MTTLHKDDILLDDEKIGTPMNTKLFITGFSQIISELCYDCDYEPFDESEEQIIIWSML